ncbi:hypothetical protein M513_08675 [Trichuris suis]|uniref:HTH CENPB-type domain-containing protein n=1 Tax=Trichuris suis TaxID=68888 RepID=A0A085LZQ2_9BILA|nr:hypothetical protein M513_08675 [Trichuris suis]
MADRRDVSGRRTSLHEKRERKVLSLYEKLKILDLLNSGMSCAEVGRRVGKNESSIRSIKQKQAEIRQSLCAAPTMAKRVSVVRDKVLVKAEKALSLWIEDMSQKHVPVDGRMIREKALSLYEHFGPMTETPERKAFMASKGWLASFVNRYNLKNLRVTGEAASADQESASTFPQEFRRLVGRKGYLPEQVYNCDETALFWKKMPSRTYIHKDARQAMGFKAFKDRLNACFVRQCGWAYD